MLIAMCVTAFVPAFAIDLNGSRQTRTVESVIDVPVGTEVDATFVCNTNTTNSSITLKADHSVVANMKDTGNAGDEKKNDDIYSATVTLSSDKRGSETYYAYDGDVLVSTYTVNYYNELTDADFAVKDAINSQLLKIETENEGKTDEQISDKIYDYLTSCSNVESVARTGNNISYTTDAGITSAYAKFSSNTKGTTVAGFDDNYNPSTTDTDDELLSWTNPNILVLRPFRNIQTATADGFHTDVYIEAADKIASQTGGQTITFDDENANPYNFAEYMDKVGFVLIDSHGVDLEVGGRMASLIVMQNVNNDGITSADWSSGRVVDLHTEGLIGVSGEYIRAHYEDEGRRLENTICYFGICVGMKYDSIKVPIYEMGARVVMGYTETVSTWYDNNMVVAIASQLAKQSNDTSRNFTLEESIEYAKSQYGDVDPAGWGAVLETYGTLNVSLKLPDNYATEIIFADTQIDAIVNQNTSIFVSVLAGSEEAHGYTQEWSSSDESIVKIVGPRMIKGVDSGTATITCKISGNGYSIEKHCTVNVSYVEVESVSISVSKSNLNTSDSAKIICTVYPRNASNRSYTIHSTNEGSVTVNGNYITAIAPGKSVIWAETEKEEIVTAVTVAVGSKKTYKLTTDIDESYTYAIAHNNSSDGMVALSGKVSGDYIDMYPIEEYNGYISTTLSGNMQWKLVPKNEGFYIYNNAEEKYLTLVGDDGVEFTDSPKSIFAFNNKKLMVVNTESSTNYLRYRPNNDGFCFGTRAGGAAISLYRLLDFNDDSAFSTVTFKDYDGSSYTQVVENGQHAVALAPMPRSGYTFLGWDGPLSNITEDMTVNAMYRKGETDKIVVTFMHTDGTVIDTQELNEGSTITPPTVPDELNGKTFAGWSETISKAERNMTVFAIYEQHLLGDANLDNVVNTGDATIILRYAASAVTLNDIQLDLADFTEDGVVNTGDATAILKSLVI